ncbi:MAG: tRNA uridine-5-carboxymethylaminomethyl(34) synthesis enzyme MnmG [Candidatus Omnitrophica bacterium]|nr:tRNA uridine-5-carboxymethylaminomethyl(34) synthesis enzyme MnmG [Candidatus Omnitrophota bacterium]MCB9783798.1 tRNA uridine-5-carboxymethylaminomethyl(34) synthesis enzyme MnmG [Candidatus Omnitrophota bacterium]
MPSTNFDIIVIGAGHAGLEAALAGARMGLEVGLFTFDKTKVAQMSCNPAIGGVAKGQLAREVDALGGAMGLIIDRAMIHFRMLNRSKGPAVQSPRAQADRAHYAKFAGEVVEATPGLTLIEGEVAHLELDKDPTAESGYRVVGIGLKDGREFGCRAAILTTGTFLKGLMHEGERKSVGGRVGDQSSEHLSDSIARIGLRMGRLKTGTPPRLHRETIHWDELEIQESEPLTYKFSYWQSEGYSPLIKEGLPCHITYTTDKTHEVIANNFHRSPLFSGEIQGVGPRYCPSIEDKVKRFSDKPRHQIFLEPDGLDVVEVYPNGVSTSLPAEVQIAFLRTVPGLEEVEMVRPGYAVEYDYVDPTQLLPTLSIKSTPNLFLAGQINGTSGYEEAAGQGLIAGVNAALWLQGRDPFILGRDEAYIGVLVDDLVTRGATEPYRMFTSRAEYRLLLRQDNADLRLTPRAAEIGLVGRIHGDRLKGLLGEIDGETQRLHSTRISPSKRVREKVESVSRGEFKKPSSLSEVLERSGINYAHLQEIELEARRNGDEALPTQTLVHPRVAEQVEISVKYRGYLDRQIRQIHEQKRLESQAIPINLDYLTLEGMRNEARQKLSLVRPLTLGQASRVEGVSPADIAVLMAFVKRFERNGAHPSQASGNDLKQ